MKRILWTLLLLTTVAVFYSKTLHGDGTTTSGNPPNPPPICPSCAISNTSTIVSKVGDKKLSAAHLEIPASYVPQGSIKSVSFEILSGKGKRLFHTFEASAKRIDSYVVIELPEGQVKVAQRHLKKGNSLRIILNTREDSDQDERDKSDSGYNSDKNEKYRKP